MQSHRAAVGQVVRRIRWEELCMGWAKLNTDGSCLGNPGICGGVVQDELGGWLGGFSSKIGITTSFLAKLWPLREGLILFQNLQLTALEMEFRCKAIVYLLANSSYSFAQKNKKLTIVILIMLYLPLRMINVS